MLENIDIVHSTKVVHIKDGEDPPNASGEARDQSPHARDIARVRETLVESIRRVDRLVRALYQARHLSDGELQRINSLTTIFDKVDQLLDVISEKPVEAFQCFLGALSDTNQSHMNDLLINPGYSSIVNY